MKTLHANVLTANAGRYLTRLCRHFSHKVPATWEDRRGEIHFPMGTCRLEASDTALWLQSEAGDSESLERLSQVIGSHLERFAAGAKEGEELAVVWDDAIHSEESREKANG